MVHEEDYHNVVSTSWNKPLQGRPMDKLLFNLLRLQAPISRRSKKFSHITSSMAQAKTDLLQAQEDFIIDRMNSDKIERVKKCTEALIH